MSMKGSKEGSRERSRNHKAKEVAALHRVLRANRKRLRVPRIKAARFATRIPNERVPMFYYLWLFIEQTDQNI